jgi:hypothetical protein
MKNVCLCYMSKLYAVIEPTSVGDHTFRGKSPKSAASKVLTHLVKVQGKCKSHKILIIEINNDRTPVLTKTHKHEKVFEYTGSWDATPTVIKFGSKEVVFDGKPVLQKIASKSICKPKPTFY